MKKYKSFLESHTTTLEFYVKNKKILLLYNGANVDFTTFCNHYPESERILRQLYQYIVKTFHSIITPSPDWMETLIKFINEHLQKYDDIMDVIIRDNGKVEVNLEK